MRKALSLLIVLIILISAAPLAFGHGMSEEDQLRAAEGGFMDFFPLGAMHMLTGYDHLLFLFGVVFFLTRFKDILKFITAFTIGHSITLIFATFLSINANYFLIDAVIALTVCYKGFDNLGGFRKYLNVKSPNLLAMVFIFGLIHGFGLSTRLQQLTIGSGMDLLAKIISFNIGVEVGQVVALTIILLVLSFWRRTESFTRFSTASNTALIIVGGLLFIMQLHGYSHETAAESYPINKDAHIHAHKSMDITSPIQQEGNTDNENTSKASSGQHIHEPGGTPHPDHVAETVPAGQHVHEPNSKPHADHVEEPVAPEGQHIHKHGDKPHADH